MPIPVTVFTGFLGAGKTSIILALLKQLPQNYNVVLLKNEFGDIEVDSKLAQQSSLAAVSEILNGCMCCVLVGQMETALLEIREKYRPDRIFIECSGSAFPATLAFQIRKIQKDTDGDIKLDAIVTVIDAENFSGYEDTSPTAKMQASYSDIILINKWEHVTERALDVVMDHLHTLNDLTPKIRCRGRDAVDPQLLFGVDSKLFLDPSDFTQLPTHNDEVETVTIYRGALTHTHGPDTHHDCDCTMYQVAGNESDALDIEILKSALSTLSKETVWRVKGFVKLTVNGWHILNWAFGRFDLTPHDGKNVESVRLTVMGERGEVKRAASKLAALLGRDVPL